MAYQDKLTNMVSSVAGSIGQMAIAGAVKGQKEATELQTQAQEEAALKQKLATEAQTKAYQESTAASQASAAKSLQTQVALEAGRQSGYLTSPEDAYSNTYHLTMNEAEQGVKDFYKLQMDNPELAKQLKPFYDKYINTKDKSFANLQQDLYRETAIKYASKKAYQAAKEQTAKYKMIQENPAKFIEEMVDKLKITDDFINREVARRTDIDWSEANTSNDIKKQLNNIIRGTTAEIAKEAIKEEDKK